MRGMPPFTGPRGSILHTRSPEEVNDTAALPSRPSTSATRFPRGELASSPRDRYSQEWCPQDLRVHSTLPSALSASNLRCPSLPVFPYSVPPDVAMPTTVF